ncbi:MAG: tellurite resistance TerB family protein [Gammaproteobacteria bacterium]|nr:tellurite resistance TerB family protein [Gammaproteobacteria bacterium]
MFDAQSLLGGLLKQATGSRNLGSKAALGMGALGVAIAAFEHFTQDNSSQADASQVKGKTPPIPPSTPTSSNAVSSNTPPPPAPPGQKSSLAPPPPPPSAEPKENDALLLIDAMIAAAHSDGHIDPEEKDKIIKQLYLVNSDQEGFDYVQKRIDAPLSLEQICSRSTSEAIAKQVYMVSLLAIKVDTSAEEMYLKQLSESLKLQKETVDKLHQQFLVT